MREACGLNLFLFRRVAWLFTAAIAVSAVSSGCSSMDFSSFEGAETDAGTNTRSPEDAGLARDASAHADASSCVPADVSNLKPVWKRPTKFHQGAPRGLCTPEDIGNYRASCLGTGDHAKCALVPHVCTACIGSAETDETYGPLIVHRGWVELNTAGCLANAMDDPTGVKCAAAVQAVRTCEMQACSANCPVASDATFSIFQACEKEADMGQCKGYIQDAECLASLADSGAEVAVCLGSMSFADKFDAIVGLFCGPSASQPPVDAGDEGG